MADRLGAAVDDNVRLETERELADRMQGRLQAERQAIARELHDALAQGITAVRALAGAIVQRTEAQPTVSATAQSIVAVTGAMQEGVRGILHRLRPPSAGQPRAAQLAGWCAAWQRQHPGIQLQTRLDIGSEVFADAIGQAVLRMVQEGLTNVLRHSGADRVELSVARDGAGLQVLLADNGAGRKAGRSAQAGSGLGLTGMAERMAALGGRLQLDNPASGGFRLLASLPVIVPASPETLR